MTPEQFQQQLDEYRGSLEAYTVTYEGEKPPNLEDWQRAFGDISPEQVYHRFANVAVDPSRMHLRVALPKDDRTPWHLDIFHGQLPDNNRLVTNNRFGFEISPNKTLTIRSIDLQDSLQDKRVMPRYLSSAIEMFKQMGAENLFFDAEKIGGYVWAKAGCLPANEKTWEGLKTQIREVYDTQTGVLTFKGDGYSLLTKERNAIDNLLSMPFSEVSSGLVPILKQLDRELCRDEGHSVTIGKALLMHHVWQGRLPLDDADPNYQRFHGYISGADRSARI